MKPKFQAFASDKGLLLNFNNGSIHCSLDLDWESTADLLRTILEASRSSCTSNKDKAHIKRACAAKVTK